MRKAASTTHRRFDRTVALGKTQSRLTRVVLQNSPAVCHVCFGHARHECAITRIVQLSLCYDIVYITINTITRTGFYRDKRRDARRASSRRWLFICLNYVESNAGGPYTRIVYVRERIRNNNEIDPTLRRDERARSAFIRRIAHGIENPAEKN